MYERVKRLKRARHMLSRDILYFQRRDKCINFLAIMFYSLPVNTLLDCKTVPKVSCNILLDLKIDPKRT